MEKHESEPVQDDRDDVVEDDALLDASEILGFDKSFATKESRRGYEEAQRKTEWDSKIRRAGAHSIWKKHEDDESRKSGLQ